jgi:hypothetical protein
MIILAQQSYVLKMNDDMSMIPITIAIIRTSRASDNIDAKSDMDKNRDGASASASGRNTNLWNESDNLKSVDRVNHRKSSGKK